SRTDGSAFALRLAVDLKKKGFDVWIDREDIKAGLEWDTEIEKALESCDCVLFLETEKSVVSDTCLDEVHYALEHNKKVIPLIYIDSRTPFRLNRLQHIDFTKNYDTGLAQLVNELEGNTPAVIYPPEEKTPRIAPKLPFSTKNYRSLVIVTCLAVLITAIVLLTAKNKSAASAETKGTIALRDTLTNKTGELTNVPNAPVINIKEEDRKSKEITVPVEKGGTQLSYTSKYDFVQGDKIIAYEDFKSVNLGDFPLKWNTNASAQVVTVDNMKGKWLKIGEKSIFHPEFITNLPENFTFEFDLGVNNANYFSPLCLNIANLKKPEDFVDYAYLVSIRPEHAVHLEFSAANAINDGVSKLVTGKMGVTTINNAINYKVWDVSKNNVAHISLWRQNQRLRVYLNGEKIWDSPRAFEAPGKYNAITFAFYGPYGKEDYYLLSNIRLAVGAPDTRK
ncbi:MAG: toll/interleukin-1 receptor domain-containing protein, partial [Chitinophagaceae bacterium]